MCLLVILLFKPDSTGGLGVTKIEQSESEGDCMYTHIQSQLHLYAVQDGQKPSLMCKGGGGNKKVIQMEQERSVCLYEYKKSVYETDTRLPT